ncbi:MULTISPECIES: hypothetical protein [Phyllobacteriaceae]|nr:MULTISPECIES: hypothetical protein [Mesorhizobium]MBN9235660.1 hypothetical protein [Mesorhizobium sp.]MDQ0331186.1 hypothetical protein [Mesorhizobium sp. YL-MeA3-2017]
MHRFRGAVVLADAAWSGKKFAKTAMSRRHGCLQQTTTLNHLPQFDLVQHSSTIAAQGAENEPIRPLSRHRADIIPADKQLETKDLHPKWLPRGKSTSWTNRQ